MATRSERIDDITGERLYGGDPVTFSVDGVDYEIDLTESNHRRLLDVFRPYIDASRRAHYRTTHLATKQ